MASELKTLHPVLFARVRLYAFGNVALGVALFITQYVPKVKTPNAHHTQLYELLPFTVWGLIFMVIGAGMAWGLYKGERTYNLTRRFIQIAIIYNVLWLTALVLTIFTQSPSAASVLILWAVFAYEHWLLLTDTGWGGAILLRDIRTEGAKKALGDL